MLELIKYKNSFDEALKTIRKANDMLTEYCRQEYISINLEIKFMPEEHGVYTIIEFNTEEVNKNVAKMIDHIYEDFADCNPLDFKADKGKMKVMYFKGWRNE